jgi:hypothetical protein
MKTSLFILIVFFYFYHSLFADSPLTSTYFSKAYQNEKMVILASGTHGRMITELMEWLASENNPVDVKMAIINCLGWDTKNRKNSSMFFKYLKKVKGYKDHADFEANGKDFELLCLAYMKAMENYFEVDDAIDYAENAKSKNPESYTFNIILALIKAQKALNYNWCEVYLLTNRVREDKSFIMDINNGAINIIFKYMDQYKESCGK